MLKNILKIIAVFIIGMAGGFFADQIFWPYLIERPFFYQNNLEGKEIYINETKEIIIKENTALENAIEKVEKVITGVKSKTGAGETLEGSGLIVAADGLIVTLADLVPQGSDFSFFIEEKALSYQVLKRDLKENLALIQVEKDNLPTLSFASLDDLKLGERVFLVGAAFNDKINKKIVNEGIVKCFDKEIIETNIFEEEKLSGSTLFNIEGEILGLNIVNSKGEISAIPNSKIREFAGF